MGSLEVRKWELSESRIVADYTDYADYGIWVYRRFLLEWRG